MGNSQQQIREIDQLIRGMQTALRLQYCSEDPNEPPFGWKSDGIRRSIPAGGVIEIKDEFMVDPKHAYDKVRLNKEPEKTLLRANAREIVGAALAAGKQRGVLLLTGDEEQDEKGRAEARKLWRRFRMTTDESTVGAYNEETESFRLDPRNANRPVRGMNRSERQAQARLDKFRLEELAIPITGEHRCVAKHCGYWSVTPDELAVHYKATSHGPGTVAAIEGAPEAVAGDIQAKVQDYEAQRAERRRKRQEAKLAASGIEPDEPQDPSEMEVAGA